MSAALAILLDEHRSMAAMLKSLLAQVAQARAGGAPPDFTLAAATLEYLQTYPERLHHPKEDETLFRLLRRRCAEARPTLDELEAQHLRGAEWMQRLNDALAQGRAAGSFDAFEPVLAGYAAFQWQHMRTEEEVILPLAERHLLPEDWAQVEAAFAANRQAGWSM
jgi:branched-chain amino acid transport system ATP-binding protein